MKTAFLALGTMILTLASGPQSRASVIPFGFSGAGVSGSGLLTIAPDPQAGDPAGAYRITDASGTFSDSNIGISNAMITGLVALDPVNPPRGAPVPESMSLYTVMNPPGKDTAISYDNLFYPGGSPITCPDYPFAGGFLDVYGAMFTLDNSDILDFWSDGEGPGMPLSYGVGVIDATRTVIDFQFSGVSAMASVPEPGLLWLLGAALLGGFVWLRRTAWRHSDP